MKKLISLFLILFVFCLCFTLACAEPVSDNEYIDSQLNESGVTDVYNDLDKQTKELLKDLGIDEVNFEKVFNISFSSFFDSLAEIFKSKMKTPFNCFLSIIAIIVLCAALGGLNDGFNKQMTSGTFNTAAALFVSVVIIVPLGKCISAVSSSIEAASAMMISLVPILCILAASTGKVFSSVALNALGVGCAQAVSEVCSVILMPVFNCLLGVGIVGAVAPEYRIDEIIGALRKYLSIGLGLMASVYFSVLGVKSSLAGTSDTVGLKTAKLLVSDFVPVIGSAISDSIGTISSYIGVTRSVVSAFGIIAVLAIFLPVAVQSLIWIFVLGVSSAAAGVFGLKSIESLLKCAASTVSVLLVILVFIILLFIVNLGIVLMIRGGG